MSTEADRIRHAYGCILKMSPTENRGTAIAVTADILGVTTEVVRKAIAPLTITERLRNEAKAAHKDGGAMTTDQIMALINSYLIACDDLGANLFEPTAQATDAKHKAAAKLWQQIRAEIDRLHSEVAP